MEPPKGRLVAQSLPPIKVMKTIKPTRILKSSEGGHIYDFGQHFMGWAELCVSGPAGAKVTLRYAGRVNYDNMTLDRRNNTSIACAEQTDTYILKGQGVETWEPRFTLHGFRYAEVLGFPGTPTLDALEARVVYSSVEASGTFTCSNPLVNQIHRNARWTFMSSFQSIPQDATDRDERAGWLGDSGFVAEDYIYDFDTVGFWSKWLDDIRDCQGPGGGVPEMAPSQAPGDRTAWPAWQSTYALLVWYVYQYYDDRRILQEHYDGVKKLVDYFSAAGDGHIISTGLGDHMEPRNDGSSSHFPMHTPAPLCSTAYYYYSAWILCRMAEVLGCGEDAGHYADLVERIKEAFNGEFFDERTNQYATGSQTSNALPLYLGLVPEGRQEAVLRNLVDDILTRHDGHLSTGIVGANALEQALPEYGRADVMYTIATRTTFPSWGYMVVNGATTIWEDWEGSNRRSVSMKMLASVAKFLYKDLAGIGPASPGYGRIVIKLNVVGDLTFAKATINTVRGTAATAWEKGDGFFKMGVTIPANTTARVWVPKAGMKDVAVTESGSRLWGSGALFGGVAGVAAGTEGGDYVIFDVASGSYAFRLTGQRPTGRADD